MLVYCGLLPGSLGPIFFDCSDCSEYREATRRRAEDLEQ